jgi:flagellar basal body-associated protein FliL
MGALIGIIIIVLLLAAGGAYFFYIQSQEEAPLDEAGTDTAALDPNSEDAIGADLDAAADSDASADLSELEGSL